MHRLAVLVALAGCRFHFDERADAAADGTASCGHTFCDTFDRSGPAEAAWTRLDATAGGTATLAGDIAISPPSSLRIDLPTMAGVTPVASALLREQLPQATTGAVIDLWMSYATATTMNTEADLVRLTWDTPPAGCTTFGFDLVRDGTGPFNLQETYDAGCLAGGNVNNYNVTLDNGPLAHVRLEIVFGTTQTGHLRLFVDGTAVVDKPPAHDITPSTLALQVGAAVVRNGQTPWLVRYDDVLVDLQ